MWLDIDWQNIFIYAIFLSGLYISILCQKEKLRYREGIICLILLFCLSWIWQNLHMDLLGLLLKSGVCNFLLLQLAASDPAPVMGHKSLPLECIYPCCRSSPPAAIERSKFCSKHNCRHKAAAGSAVGKGTEEGTCGTASSPLYHTMWDQTFVGWIQPAGHRLPPPDLSHSLRSKGPFQPYFGMIWYLWEDICLFMHLICDPNFHNLWLHSNSLWILSSWIP